MYQEKYMDFKCASGLKANRYVSVTPATDTVAYTAAGAQPDGVTIRDEDNLKISVQLLNNNYASYKIDLAGTVSVGDELQVTTDGKAIQQTNGAIAGYAKIAGVDGSLGVGYNLPSSGIGSAVGTPESGVTAVEEVHGSFHKTTLTVSSTLPAIAGGANLAVGKKLYTLPAGAKIIKSAYMSMALDESDGNITADTPDVGLGTVIGSGAVADLSGTATFENILTGQTAADCNGTATVKTAMPTGGVGGLAIETGDAHTVHFNVADGFAAGGEAACAIAGTVTIEWYDAD